MMISKKMEAALNEQINKEQYSAHLYLAMAAAFERMTLKVFAAYYYKQAEEETAHAMKIFEYVIDQGGTVILKAIGEPRTNYDSVQEIVDLALEHEIKVTNMINDLVALAEKENDFATRGFLEWFVKEQVEEVASAQEMSAVVKMTPTNMMLALESRVAKMMES